MKLFLIIAVSLLGLAASAQTKMTNQNGLALDTAVNATPRYAQVYTPGYKTTMSIVVAVTKISGTVAGSVNWQGSNDGINFATISSTTLVDATGSYQFNETQKHFLYYRAQMAGTGTMSASFFAWSYTSSDRF